MRENKVFRSNCWQAKGRESGFSSRRLFERARKVGVTKFFTERAEIFDRERFFEEIS